MNLPTKYSSLSQYQKKLVRVLYHNKQNGLCYHCQSSLDDEPPRQITKLSIDWNLFPKNFLKYPNHLHHSHTSDLTIGVVHSYSNAVLWQYYRE